jgi:superfamily I DNA/RNA helicase
LSGENLKLFNDQKREKKLDRFDLVVLLKAYFEKYKKFETKREYQTFVKDKLVKKTRKNKIEYSLIIVDEFQNYLKEQLDLFRNSLNKDTESVVYVGDIAQQVKLGTIKKLEDVGVVDISRNIRLNKVYRNTKNILSFIQDLNYKIEIPTGVKEGPVVIEKVLNNTKEEIEHIKNNISKYEKGSIGILSKNESYLLDFKKEFEEMKNIHMLSMAESQGVEFDIVFIVGLDQCLMEVKHNIYVLPEHLEERKRMQKDLLYVALTRAITELHLLGNIKLKDILNNL